MSTTRDPFGDLLRLQERMNRLFEQALSRGGASEEEMERGAWAPAVDIEEDEERILLRADLPGIRLEQVELRIQENRLTLHGERPFVGGTTRENFHRIERPYGTFHRAFVLPRGIEQEAIQARLVDGVLEVTLPKRAETKPRQIRVEVG
jgi:HSP20 family protein